MTFVPLARLARRAALPLASALALTGWLVTATGGLAIAGAAASATNASVGTTATAAKAATRAASSTLPATTRNVIVQLFEWNWPSVASECSNVLGPDGYGAVQISPPQAHYVDAADNYPWWEQYQPVDYSLTSRLGDQAQFEQMIGACHAAGVKIYADVLINNMSGFNGGPTSDGSTFSQYNYPTVPYTSGNFHSCQTTITNWDDAYQVQNCEESGLADLATEQPAVRSTLAGYMNHLLALGVDGFRLDSAKEVPEADISAIESELSRSVFVFQDVPYGAGQPITPSMYTPTGAVADGQYQDAIGQTFQSGKLASLNQFGTQSSWLPSADVVVYTDDHDSQRDGDANILTFANGQLHTLANVFMLAYPYGIPKIMSSYHFGSYDQGPPQDSNGNALNATCTATTYVCEQRIPAIVGMVGFNNAVGGSAINNWWSDGNNQIAFGRGAAGFVAINREGSALSHTWQTDMAPGVYCDVIHGALSGGSCSGPTLTVNASGQVTATVNSMDAVAIDDASLLSSGSTTTTTVATSTTTTAPSTTTTTSPPGGPGVTETVNVTVPVNTAASGDTVYLAGNLSVLGEGQSDWAANGVAMTKVNDTHWMATIYARSATTLSYKYVLGGSWANNEVTAACASVANRSMSVNGGTHSDVVANWEGPSTCGSAQAVIDLTVPSSTPAADTVYIAGNFSALGTGMPAASDWGPGLYAMNKIASDEWQILVPAVAGTTLDYKFDLNGTWANSEETSSCASAPNRTFAFNGAGSSYTATDAVGAWQGLNGC
jgi:alpha-amylase